jgi:hypothetical protein
MPKTHSAKASAFRRKAEVLGRLAACAQSAVDHDQLLRMQNGCLTLAAQEDTLDGLPPLPPARAAAIPTPL